MSELFMVKGKVSSPLHLLYYVSFNVMICSVMFRRISSQGEFPIEHIVLQLHEHAGKVALFMLL